MRRVNKNTAGRQSSKVAEAGDKCAPWCHHVYGPVAVIAITCYLNGLNGDFVHDDIPAIEQNRDVLGLTSMPEVFINDFWGTSMGDPASHKSYRPLTVLSFR